MCGIVGYVGLKQAAPVLLDGLKRLSYRGYDSAGIAVSGENGSIQVRKAEGKLNRLEALLANDPPVGCTGIGHTRWATHGEPSRRNAHPHTDASGNIAIVHNGIIENDQALEKQLVGVPFVSDTDTEVIAQLIGKLYDGDMCRTLMRVIPMLEGSYALGVMCKQEPGLLFCVRKDSPLVMGFHHGEGFIASDIPALMAHTSNVVFLQDQEIGVVGRDGIRVFDRTGQEKKIMFSHVNWDGFTADKDGYPHYMLKEINEQPQALARAMAARMDGDRWQPFSDVQAKKISKITIVACGTAYHAGVLGKYAIEGLARIPVEVDVASEYRYRNPVIWENECVIAISQSGETADTLAALRYAKRSGARVIAICNVRGSSIVREAGEENTLLTHAGPEVAVASTKAFLTQAAVLILLAATLGKMRGQKNELMEHIKHLPAYASQTLACEAQVKCYAAQKKKIEHVFFIGRGMDYAIALEGALKLKEISYLFSEAYASGELKHGPLALLEEGRLVVAIVTQEALLEKSLSNIREVIARGADVLVICCNRFVNRFDEIPVLAIPDAEEWIAPMLAAIPLQLFAYHMALNRGCDVDQPRNLAKSVTVE